MTSGPTPQPRELKARKGNPSKENLNPEDAPHVDYVNLGTIPAIPEFVSNIDGASDVWDRLVPILLTMGVFGQGDTVVVGRYCVAIRMLERVTEDLNNGYEMEYKTGARQVSPAMSAYVKFSDQCLKIEKELGLTPSARQRVSTWGGNNPPARPTDDSEPDANPATIEETKTPDFEFRLTGE